MGILIFIGLQSFAQNLNCDDFKEGTFYIPVDTIVNNRNTLIRKGNTQIEYTTGIDGENTKYIILEWIDDCSYRAKYDKSKMELDQEEVFFNKNNGIVIQKINITASCMGYIATVILPNGEEIKQNGKICKELY